MKKRYTIEYIRSGQSRPYGDSVDEFIVSCEFCRKGGEWEPFDVAEDHFDKFAKEHGSNFYPKSAAPDWAAPVLTQKTKESIGVWRYTVTSAYTD